ncbi:MAG: ATP-binding cassette domain-containing protein [Candidatus Krumholzibacteria bacterium]|nr:ATP-binding cassette domain-containing protein [Candidatus Krumholzibacteria bacterium]MDP6669315.1 ATP-binding cassette domain-containing protein [Candidatus Krumholzibacteria bacterium]MDP6797476.1 ATP-binding cassette domain-containing protein [Candidatus Krumholzibacteria bacterium]MDP7021004.1 ATP-binding cassette domain-containing protein [Candidatus Krumholzibacteria bacterium]
MIQIESISKHFGSNIAVDSLSYEFSPGKLTGFLGPNGAGKTTTIRMIMNILVPDSGRVLLEGRVMNEAARNRTAYLPEERGLYRDMKVMEHLQFFASLKGVPRRESAARAEHWLERLGLSDRSGSRIKELSKGMQQKIQFAGTLLHEPELILLDEPFSGLDPVNTESLREIILELKDEGRTVIFSTHMMEQAEQLCDEIVLIDEGKIVLSGNLSSIRESFGSVRLRIRYQGSSDVLMNDARVQSCEKTGEGSVEILLNSEAEIPAALRDWSQKLDLLSVEPVQPSLHNIFLQSVGRGVSETAGGAL